MMHRTGTELARPFVPARDFALSKQFYLDLGFALLLDAEVAIFGIGNTSFLLQNHYHPAWAGHFMMQLMVDDLDAWWTHIAGLDLPSRYPVTAPQPRQTEWWCSPARGSNSAGKPAGWRRRTSPFWVRTASAS